jgi:hypothetical protein
MTEVGPVAPAPTSAAIEEQPALQRDGRQTRRPRKPQDPDDMVETEAHAVDLKA